MTDLWGNKRLVRARWVIHGDFFFGCGASVREGANAITSGRFSTYKRCILKTLGWLRSWAIPMPFVVTGLTPQFNGGSGEFR
jgi:hypothetical protein